MIAELKKRIILDKSSTLLLKLILLYRPYKNPCLNTCVDRVILSLVMAYN